MIITSFTETLLGRLTNNLRFTTSTNSQGTASVQEILARQSADRNHTSQTAQINRYIDFQARTSVGMF